MFMKLIKYPKFYCANPISTLSHDFMCKIVSHVSKGVPFRMTGDNGFILLWQLIYVSGFVWLEANHIFLNFLLNWNYKWNYRLFEKYWTLQKLFIRQFGAIHRWRSIKRKMRRKTVICCSGSPFVPNHIAHRIDLFTIIIMSSITCAGISHMPPTVQVQKDEQYK